MIRRLLSDLLVEGEVIALGASRVPDRRRCDSSFDQALGICILSELPPGWAANLLLQAHDDGLALQRLSLLYLFIIRQRLASPSAGPRFRLLECPLELPQHPFQT